MRVSAFASLFSFLTFAAVLLRFRLCVVTIFPLIYTLGQQNNVAWENTKLLEANNIVSNTTNECQFLQQSVSAWLRTSAKVHVSYGLIRDEEDLIYAVWGQLLPVRCEWQRSDGVITTCPEELSELDICQQWSDTGVRNDTSPDDTGWATVDYFADALGVRGGGLRDFQLNTTASADFGDGLTEVPYYVKVIYNQNHTVALTYVHLCGVDITLSFPVLPHLSFFSIFPEVKRHLFCFFYRCLSLCLLV